MSDRAELIAAARNDGHQIQRDLDALERRLLAEERRERARELTARFTNLKLVIGE